MHYQVDDVLNGPLDNDYKIAEIRVRRATAIFNTIHSILKESGLTLGVQDAKTIVLLDPEIGHTGFEFDGSMEYHEDET